MILSRNATLLLALDAVALDLETTGLAPRSARIVEIGAVRVASGRFEEDSQTYRTLVRPGEQIPASATRIHGIDQSMVRSARMFAEVWPSFSSYLGNTVAIGHTIDFDLAVLRRECERTGLPFCAPAALDVRLLAQVCEPNLAGYSLENLAAWLDLEISGRHSALGDATAAARIFCALVPRLRVVGIRTLGEALHSSREFVDLRSRHEPMNWLDLRAKQSREIQPVLQVDLPPYQKRVIDIMTTPARSVVTGTPISEALVLLMQEQISSVYIFPDSNSRLNRPELTGIVTERDILRAIEAHGSAALTWPVERVMSQPLRCIDSGAFAYQAISRMNRLNVRHLGVTSEDGEVVGALSARDLLKLRAGEASELGDEIEQASDVHELARAWSRLAPVCSALLDEGLPARDIAAVISSQLAQLTRRSAALAERVMRETGQGGSPTDYAVLLLGSAGRGESLLALDQDTALVYADDAPQDADRWFETLGKHFSTIMHEVGVPYCKGGVMAGNAAWRGSAAVWRRRIEDWVQRSSPQDLLSVDIFFDMRGVHGRFELADSLRHNAFEIVRGQAAFAKLLVEASGAVPPWRSWFGGWRTENGRIDLKKVGLFGIVSSARALAICHGVMERSTAQRIEGIKALQLGAERDLDSLIDAHGTFLDLMLKQQVADIESGLAPTNAVAVKSLRSRDGERLRSALQKLEHLDRMTQDLLFQA